MKKRLFTVILSLALVFAMCVPAFAWDFPATITNTTDLVDTDADTAYAVRLDKRDKENNLIVPDITDGEIDEAWNYAIPYTLDSSKPIFFHIMYDDTYVYILEVRTGEVTIKGADSGTGVRPWSNDSTIYNIMLPAPVGASGGAGPVEVFVGPPAAMNASTAVGTTLASGISSRKFKFSGNTGTADSGSAFGFSKGYKEASSHATAAADLGFSSYCTRTADGYFAETRIPFSLLNENNTTKYTPAEGDTWGIRFYAGRNGESLSSAYVTGAFASGAKYAICNAYHLHNGNDDRTAITIEAAGYAPLKTATNTVRYDASSRTFNLTSVTDFKWFLDRASTDGYTFKHFTLCMEDNIDLNPGWDGKVTVNGSSYTLPDPAAYEWPVIPSFAGTINGNGHTLSGIYLEDPAATLAPITTLTGTIRNLAITNSFICGTHASGRGTNLAANGKIGGLVGNLQTGALLENIYMDATVWAVSYSAQFLGGLVAYVPANDNTIRNVVAKGVVGSSKPGTGAQDVNSSGGCRASAIIANVNWKTGVLLDQVVLASDIYLNASALSSSAAYGANNKFSTTDMYRKPSNCVNGIFATFAEAEAAGAVLNKAGTATNTYVYSPVLGGIAPATVVHLFDYNLAVQKKDTYTLEYKGENYSVTDLRLLTTVDDLDVCNLIGFKVSVKVGSREPIEKSFSVSRVYTSVEAAGATITAAELGGKYISALVVEGVSATEDVTVTVTPIKIIAETTYEDPTPYTIRLVNGEFQ